MNDIERDFPEIDVCFESDRYMVQIYVPGNFESLILSWEHNDEIKALQDSLDLLEKAVKKTQILLKSHLSKR